MYTCNLFVKKLIEISQITIVATVYKIRLEITGTSMCSTTYEYVRVCAQTLYICIVMYTFSIPYTAYSTRTLYFVPL